MQSLSEDSQQANRYSSTSYFQGTIQDWQTQNWSPHSHLKKMTMKHIMKRAESQGWNTGNINILRSRKGKMKLMKMTWEGKLSSVQSLSRVRLFVTPWIAAHQASLFITISRSSLRLMSIESVMPSSHLILGRPLLLLPPIPKLRKV